jgi:cyclohexadieny/prephenate dehydrogenase
MSTPILSQPLEPTVAIVGVGLIGGSLAAALKQRGIAKRVIGVGRNRLRLADAKAAGLIDEFSTDLTQAARESQLVVVCTPVDRIVADVRQAAAAMPAGSLITDAGSVKGVICEELADLPAAYIGSHPLAGSEKQGFEHASATLFDQRLCVITPTKNSPPAQLQRLHAFGQAVGMQTCERSPAEHDAILAVTSHLPHAVAAALASVLAPELRRFAASGFRDTTRIAAGDPELWTAIFQQNSAALSNAIAALEARLGALKTALQQADSTALKKWLAQAKTNRDALA